MTIVIIIAAFIGVAALIGGVAVLIQGNNNSTIEDRLSSLAEADTTGKKPEESHKSVLAQPLDDVPGVLEEFLAQHLNLRLLLTQADVHITPGRFALISLIIAGAGLLLCVMTPLPIFLAPVAGALLGLLPTFWLRFKRKRRLAQFAKQLPEAMELLSRSLRAGHSLGAGCSLVAQEMKPPISTEFQRVFEEQNLGVSMEEALDSLADRVPNLDLRFFVTAVILQRQTGGDLAEILDKIGYLIRERFKLFGTIQALTGEGRLSGIVLLAMPPVLFLVMLKLNPAYTMVLFTDPLGKKMLIGAVISQLIGAYVIRKIINIRV